MYINHNDLPEFKLLLVVTIGENVKHFDTPGFIGVHSKK